MLFASLAGSGAAAVVPAAPGAVVDGAAVAPKVAVVAAGAAEDVEAGVEPPNKGAALDVEVGAVVVFGPKSDGAGVVDAGAAVVVAGLVKREFWAGAEAVVDVDVVEGTDEAVGNKEAGFEAGAAVLAGVDPPSPLNRVPAAGAVVAAVLVAGAVVVAVGFEPKSEAVLAAGVDSAGLDAAAPPLKRELDGAPLVLLVKRLSAGFWADEALVNRLDPELLAVG